MAIRMRNNNDKNAVCCNCKETQDQVLNMFDICIGNTILTICDECNNKILYKTLNAECMKNGRVKSQKDIQIINRRKQKRGPSYFGGDNK